MSLRPRLPVPVGWSRLARTQLLPSSGVASSRHTGSLYTVAQPIRRCASIRGLASNASSPLATSSSTPHIHLPTLPTFRAKGSDIKILYEPSEFYQFLLGRIKRAKRRIFLASLYIGKEETELIAALHAALKANTALELHIVVDYLRSTREHPKSTSSASLLATLQASFPSRVHVSLYHTPALSGLAARLVPKRYNEGWGLWHGKIYGFDDDVVLSGANLSRDYFTNRQDRYIAFRGHAPLADYFHALMQRFRQLSFALEGYSTATASPRNFDLRWIPKSSSGPLGRATHVAQPNTHPRQYTDSAKQILNDFLALYARKSTASLSSPRSPVTTSDGAYDTTLQPFLQMGAFDIKQETDLVVPDVLRAAKEGANIRVDWTSGYFSLRKDYRDALLAAKGQVAIVCASPEANGFFQSKGFSKYIPPAYTYLEHRFYDELKRQGKTDSIGVTEWKRSGWTYHAKGVWLSPGAAAAAADSSARAPGEVGKGDPTLTLVGSTNYGYRSAVRDIEVNLAVQTTSPALRKALGDELRNIYQHATDKVDEALFRREDRRVGWINRLAARIIADML